MEDEEQSGTNIKRSQSSPTISPKKIPKREQSIRSRDGGRPSSRTENKKDPGKFIPGITALIVILMIITLAIRGRGSRGVCSFEHVYRKATCKAKGLRSVPSDLSEATLTLHIGTKLDKTENYFTVLTKANFSRYRQLHDLKLIKCGIEQIEGDTFSDLPTLRKLDVRFNRIQVIKEETFRGLTNVEYLDLSNNPIHTLGDFLFRNIRIEQLVFANNPALVEISSKTFAGAIVKTIVINRCNLSNIRSETFTYIAGSIEELYITNNLQPLVLPEDIFKGLKLEKLSLEDDGLNTTVFLRGLVARDICLDENPLETIEIGTYESLSSTERLSLIDTDVKTLSKSSLASLVNLQELILTENDISEIDSSTFGHMSKLQTLHLSNNCLSMLKGNFTKDIPSLRSLFLDGNKLQSVPQQLQKWLSSLDNLTLHRNPWHCNCELLWLLKWVEAHKEILQEEDSILCETPVLKNITQMAAYEFQCREPTILNATFDTDGMSLVCTAEGDPAPTVTWSSSSNESLSSALPPSRRDIFKTQSTMTVTKHGNYTCTAINVIGQDNETVNTRDMPSSGIRFVTESQEIEILETKPGFIVCSVLIALLGYIFKYQ